VKRKYSLKGKKCFNEVFRKGRRYQGTYIQCIVLKKCRYSENALCHKRKNTTQYVHVKLGIVVSKHLGKAHMRNTLKRRVRATFREILSEINESICMIVLLKKNAKHISFREMHDDLWHVIRKAKIS
jgi:ribonuclease P protein component